MADKKWYNHFVSFDEESQPTGSDSVHAVGVHPVPSKPVIAGKPGAPATAAQRVAEIASSLGQPPAFSPSMPHSSSFEEIYAAAEIPATPYNIMKVAEMLQSPHLKDLPAEVKRSSVLVALDAAGVKLQSVIEDAVRRDRALDTFESVQLRSVEELEAAKGKENQQIQTEMERLAAEHQARIQANRETIAKARERFEAWQKQKQAEEQRISDAVAPFVTENPVSTTRSPAAAPSGTKSTKQG
jgi:phage terminase small subunit